MIFRHFFIPIILVIGLTQSVTAQHAELNGLELRASGEAYSKAIRFRRIDREVLYFDPTRPPPSFKTNQKAEDSIEADIDGARVSTSFEGNRVITLVIAGAVLLGIAYIFVVFGGGLPVSLARAPDDVQGSSLRKKSTKASTGQTPLGIDAILRMQDRREALVSLCKGLLARVMTGEGILLQDSWTDRDALRRVPEAFPQREALQALVYASEKVQFGGRDVSEDEFKSHVSRLRPIWAANPA
ncbi:MAG: DUF4129 domain-containing protein [Paracoccaceae bacterium]